MERYFQHTEELAAGGKATVPRARLRPRWIRIILTAMAVLLFVLAALLDERPQLMLIGLAPLALLAAEVVWHLLKSIDDGT
jgi:hypothetical protein